MGRRKNLFEALRKIEVLVYTFTLPCCLIFAACDSDSGTVPLNSSSKDTASNEFKYNYNLLDYYYIDKNLYLGRPEIYLNTATPEEMATYVVPWDYYDIYYMYSQMNDKFTRYIDPSRSYSLFNTLNSSEEKMGAGIEIDSTNTSGKYIISQVAENSPADKVGLKVGDKIIAIEGIEITNDIIFKRLSYAAEGDTINYTIVRNSVPLDFSVVLAPYLSPTVELTFKDSIPIIKIFEFSTITSNDSGTSEEFLDALRQTEKYKATIIDLQDNGGGDGDECIPMITNFLSKGDTAIGIISADRDSIFNRQVFDTAFTITDVDGIAKDRYFVFLANNMTASCSELMLAGILSNKNYPVVGTTTYGKGIGQRYIITPSLSIAAITSMRVVDKNRKFYHKYGIEPDFAISDRELAIEKAVELAKDMNYVRTAGYGSVSTGNFAKTAVEPDTMPGFYFIPKKFSY